MKTKLALFLAIAASLISARPVLGAGVTVSPNAITNDYKGLIVFTVTGLTPGTSVQLDKYGDLNTNGVIDAGEPILQSFRASDGVLPLIGGIRNTSAVGDEDGVTNGQVRVQYYYAVDSASAVPDSFAGNFLYRVSDPLSSFTPVTNSFTVAQVNLPQGVTGIITDANSSVPLTNAAVVLVPGQGNPINGTTTDSNGSYTLHCAPGNYSLAFIRNGYFQDMSTANVTVSSGVFATRNMAAIPGTRTISGKATDAGSGAALPGTFVQGEDSTSLFAGAFSDAAGNYTLAANSGSWKAKLDGNVGNSGGFVVSPKSFNVDTTSGNVANVNFALARATALVYGTVRDETNGIPPTRFSFFAQDQAAGRVAGGFSLTNGGYAIGLVAGDWSLGIDAAALAALGYIASGTNFTVTNGQALAINFSVLHASTHLRGQVVDSTSTPVGNVNITASQMNGSGNSSVNTDGSGNFDLLLAGGDWSVQIENNAAASRNLVSPLFNFTVVNGVDINGLVMVAQISAGQRISGVVTNTSGTPITPANVFANATVNGTNYLAGSTTDGTGHYQLIVINGNWTVGLSQDNPAVQNYVTPTNQNTTVANNQVTVNFTLVPFTNMRPVISQIVKLSGQFQFQLAGESGRAYRIDTSTNLNNAANWIPVTTNTAFGGTFSFSDPNVAGRTNKFYRAVLVP